MMWYIFEKEIVQGPQKQCSQVSDTQIHKYTIHKYSFGQIIRYPYHVIYFWKGDGTRTPKTMFPSENQENLENQENQENQENRQNHQEHQEHQKHVIYFWKGDGTRTSKKCSQVKTKKT